MDNALDQPDVRANILSYLNADLDPSKETSDYLPSLLSTALINRAWSENALDLIWGSFAVEAFHLLQLLGPMMLDSSADFELWTYDTRIPPTARKWGRFTLYAKRIRHLSMGTGRRKVHHDAYTYVAAHATRDDSLFPKLRRVDWEALAWSATGPWLSTCISWLGPIKHLSCMISSEGDVWHSWDEEAYYLDRCVPRLERLELRGGWSPSQVFAIVQNRDIQELNVELRIMQASHVFKTLIQHLAVSPTLKRLTMKIIRSSSIPPTALESDLDAGSFPALEDLHIHSSINVLSFHTPPEHLVGVRFIGTDKPETGGWSLSSLSQNISDRLGLVSRIELHIKTEHLECKEMEFSSISCLAGIPVVDTFILRHTHPPDLSFDQLDILLTAWPALRVFKISGLDSFREPCGTTVHESSKWMTGAFRVGLSILDTFAFKCPHVEELEMPFNNSSPSLIRGVPRLKSLHTLIPVQPNYIDAHTAAIFLSVRTSARLIVKGPQQAGPLTSWREQPGKAWRDVAAHLPLLLEQRRVLERLNA